MIHPQPSLFYDLSTPPARLGRHRNMAWFDAHPRTRPALGGEAAFLDGTRTVTPASQGYVVSIHDARARDRRAAAGRGTCLVLVHFAGSERARALLEAVGERMAKRFRRHASTPAPS